MAAFFLDTSALIKRHLAEVGSGWVRARTAARASHTLFIAGITAVEMTSAITRRQRGGSLSAAQGAAICGHLRRHLTRRHVVREITPALMAAAMLLARSHGLRAYDAVQLAAAIGIERDHRQAGLTQVTLVSADQALNDATTAEGLTVGDRNSHPCDTLIACKLSRLAESQVAAFTLLPAAPIIPINHRLALPDSPTR